ncbi:hypothetical protein F5Y16DRAFT_384973 [Xylariaceae sp. FL0255]|nr:hypothetical protein F5Y16DRAFT_384973 [Xylariaceae sp. FL0255]
MNDLRRYFNVAPTSIRDNNVSEKDDRPLSEDDEDELSMPIVVSDIVQPGGLGRPRKLIKSSPVTARDAWSPSQISTSNIDISKQTASAPAASPLKSPSQMRLAVHIRSSPISTPFTPVNEQSSYAPAATTLASGTAKRRGRPPKSATPTAVSSASEAIESMESRKGTPNTELKKRGRPKGWRKLDAPGSTDAKRRRKPEPADGSGQLQEAKRRGRPPRPPDATVRERYLQANPEYTPYKCEWDISHKPRQQESPICPAELHNIDTLRRHVLYVHAGCNSDNHSQKDPPLLVCRYSGCKDTVPEFETRAEFERHLEKKHFAWYLWHMGDGPQNKGIWTLKEVTTNELPSYLFDADGVQITPSVRDQRVENDVEFRERKRKLKRLLYEQNENAPSEEEWIKQMLGIEG